MYYMSHASTVVVIVCSWIYIYLCNQVEYCLSLWIRIPARCNRYNIMW